MTMFNDHITTERRMKKDPLFSFNWVDALIIGTFVLFFTGILMDIIKYGN